MLNNMIKHIYNKWRLEYLKLIILHFPTHNKQKVTHHHSEPQYNHSNIPHLNDRICQLIKFSVQNQIPWWCFLVIFIWIIFLVFHYWNARMYHFTQAHFISITYLLLFVCIFLTFTVFVIVLFFNKQYKKIMRECDSSYYTSTKSFSVNSQFCDSVQVLNHVS